MILSKDGIDLMPLDLSHAEGLFEVGQQAEIWQWLLREEFKSLEDASAWVKERQNSKDSVFTIFYESHIIGSASYLNIMPNDKRLEIGYSFLHPKYWGKGINAIVKYLLLENAFEKLCYKRVEFKTDSRNFRSQRAIEKIGAKKEGVFRQHMKTRNNIWRDIIYYSILDSEWPVVKKLLKKFTLSQSI